jgi:hypothetical protein
MYFHKLTKFILWVEINEEICVCVSLGLLVTRKKKPCYPSRKLLALFRYYKILLQLSATLN